MGLISGFIVVGFYWDVSSMQLELLCIHDRMQDLHGRLRTMASLVDPLGAEDEKCTGG